MTSSQLCLLSLCVSVSAACSPPAITNEATNNRLALVDRVWTSTDPAAAPGSLRVFVSDGTLVMTSCVEVYRLARWQQTAEDQIEWDEDGARIQASIVDATDDRLHLQLQLVSEARDEEYEIARSPRVCPDLPR